MAAEQLQPATMEAMSFKFRHPDGEQHTVTVTRDEVAKELPDFLFEKLSEKVCKCEPIGETNVVDCICCDYVDDFRLVSEEPASATVPWRPAKCPITGRPFFMWIEHPIKGKVPTYGGPHNSYTLAEANDEGSFQCERYDHDAGAWRLDSIEWIDLKLVGGQSGYSNPDHAAGNMLDEPTQQKADLRKPFMFVQLHARDVRDWTQDPNLAESWQEDGHTVEELFTKDSQ